MSLIDRQLDRIINKVEVAIERSRTMSTLCYCKEGESYRHWNEAQNNRAKWCPLRTETEIAEKAKEIQNDTI